MKYLLPTTTLNNGCGLASLSTVLSRVINHQNWRVECKNASYQHLLASFKYIYSNNNLTWQLLQEILLSFVHPLDQQILWVAPLRASLQHHLASNTTYKEQTFETFVAALRELVVNKTAPTSNKYINIFNSNKEYFQKTQDAIPQARKNIRSRLFNKRYRDGTLKKYWEKTGYTLYCQHVGMNGNDAPMITAEELSILCEALKIKFAVYYPDSPEPTETIRGYAGDNSLGYLEATCNENHWQAYTLSLAERKYSDVLCFLGIQELPHLNFSEMAKKLNKKIEDKHASYDLTVEQILSQNNLSRLYEYLKKNKENVALKKPLLNAVSVAIDQNNLFGLLTLYKVMISYRNEILAIMLKNNNFNPVQFTFFFNLHISNLSKKYYKNWETFIETNVPVIFDGRGDTQAHIAIKENNLAFFQREAFDLVFIKPNYQQLTPLHLACSLNHFDVVKILIDLSINKGKHPQILFSRDKFGRTPFHFAALLPTPTILNFLLKTHKKHNQCDIDINLQDYNKKTLLHHAAMMGHLETVDFLIKRHASLELQDNEGNSPLHLAASSGHKNVVKYLGDEISKENEKRKIDNSKKVGFFRRGINRLNPFHGQQTYISIDTKNNFGETAYMKAAINGSDKIMTVLKEFNASTSQVYAYFLKAIHNTPTRDVSPKNGQIKAAKREERSALLAKRHQRLISRAVDTKGNNLIHQCIWALNYRMANILLYSLSYEKRVRLCTNQNLAKLTPLDLIKRKREQATLEQNIILGKLERLILRYDAKTYAELGKIKKIQYHYQWTQDKKSELMSTKGYRYSSLTCLYGMPALAFVQGTVQSGGNLWVGMEGAIKSHFGTSFIDFFERAISLAPERIRRPLMPLQNVFLGLNLWRNTVTRASVEVIKFVASSMLNNSKTEICSTYLTNINRLGAALAISEELTRHYAAPLMHQYWVSFEDSAKRHLGVPTIVEMTDWGLNKVNSGIELCTGVSLKNKLKDLYFWTRENVGRLPSPAEEFNTLEKQIMELVVTEDQDARNVIKSLAKILYITYCFDPLPKVYELINLANGASITDQGLQTLIEAVTLLPGENKDCNEILSTFFINTPFFKFLNLDENTLNTIFTQLTTVFTENRGDFNDLVYIQKIRLLIEKSKIDAITAKGTEIGNLLGISLGIEDAITQNILNQLLENLFKENASNPTVLEEKINSFKLFFMNGELNTDVQEMLILLAQQGSNFEDSLALLLVNTYAFQQFNFDVETLKQYSDKFSEDFRKILQESPDNVINAINGYITQSYDSAAKVFVNNNFVPNIFIKDDVVKDLATDTAIMILQQNRLNPDVANQKLQAIAQLLNGATLNENFAVTFNEILKDMEGLGYNYENMLLLFVGGSLGFEKLAVTEQSQKHLLDELKDDIHQLRTENPYDSVVALKTIIERSEIRFVDAFVVDTFTPTLRVKDGETKMEISKITKPFMMAHFSNPDLFDDLNYLLNYINDDVMNIEIISSMVKIAQANENQNQVLVKLILSSPIFQNTRLTQKEKSALAEQLFNNIEAIPTENHDDYLSQLLQVIEGGEMQAMRYYNAHQRTGDEVINDAVGNRCESAGQRAEYAAEHFMKQHSLSFYNLQGLEYASALYALDSFFYEKQGLRHGHNQRKIDNLKDVYDEMDRYLAVGFFVPDFLAGKPLDEPTRIYLAGMDPKDVRAIFGVNLTKIYLEQSSDDYYPLSFYEELNLYRGIVDAQHDYKHNHKKEEEVIFDLVNDTIYAHAKKPAAYKPLLGEYSCRDAAASILDNSKLAGENHWKGTPDELTRPIHVKESNFFKRLGNSTVELAKYVGNKIHPASGGNASIGASTTGSGVSIGLMNNITHQVYGYHFGFGKTPDQNIFENNKPHPEQSTSHHSNGDELPVNLEALAALEASNWKIVMEDYPNTQPTPLMEWMDKEWHNLVDKTYPKRDETYYREDFAKIYDESIRVATKPSDPVSSTVNEVVQSPHHVREPARILVHEDQEIPKEVSIGRKIVFKTLYYGLSAISGTAEASPALAGRFVGQKVVDAMLGSALIGWMAHLKRNDEEDNTEDSNDSNLWMRVLHSFYPDHDLDDQDTVESEPERNFGIRILASTNPTFSVLENLLYKKKIQENKERPHAPDPDKKYIPAPKELPGFPDAEKIDGKTPYSGSNKKRARWKIENGEILEWDRQHGEVEKYNKNGVHLGAWDPATGKQIKPPKNDRNIKRYL